MDQCGAMNGWLAHENAWYFLIHPEASTEIVYLDVHPSMHNESRGGSWLMRWVDTFRPGSATFPSDKFILQLHLNSFIAIANLSLWEYFGNGRLDDDDGKELQKRIQSYQLQGNTICSFLKRNLPIHQHNSFSQ